jgi:hypothetical protein
MVLENELAEQVAESRVPPDATVISTQVASGETLDSANCSTNSFLRTIAQVAESRVTPEITVASGETLDSATESSTSSESSIETYIATDEDTEDTVDWDTDSATELPELTIESANVIDFSHTESHSYCEGNSDSMFLSIESVPVAIASPDSLQLMSLREILKNKIENSQAGVFFDRTI